MSVSSESRRISVFSLLLALAATALSAQAPPAEEGLTRLLRQPDIQGDAIVFSYTGDIWLVGADGGTARRLTSDDGLELFPKISPDGRWVAFTGEYGGNKQVFVIPSAGGTPRQLTFRNDVGPLPPRGGVDNRVLGWTPDSTGIVFGAHRLPWGERMEIPYVVPVDGGMEEPLGIPQGTGGMLSPDGSSYVYTPIGREFRTWKRYYGGRAQDVWTFDLGAQTARQLTTYAGTDNQPMWLADDHIYFASDRVGGTLNLFALPATAEEGSEPRQITFHEDWDVLWPSSDRQRIVYEAGGWIWRLDPGAGGEPLRVPIKVFGDFAETVPRFEAVADDIQTASLSPSGARALFGARGEVFTVPAKKGEARNLTHSQGVRERDPAWSPDGRWVAYWSDRSGEYELYVRPAGGDGEERQITRGGETPVTWKYAANWSPDSKRLAFGDREARLRILDVDSGTVTTADRGRFGDITDHRWSPDGRWLAYTKASSDSQLPSVWVYRLSDATVHRLTSDDTAEAEPVWDPKGRYLYFLSNRDFNLTFSSFEFDFIYTDPTRVYVALLTDDAPPLLLPESDEEPGAGEDDGDEVTAADDEGEAVEREATTKREKREAKKAAAAKDAAEEEPVRVEIDLEGFESRIRAIPGAPGDYRSLAATEAGVLYLEGQGPETKLQLFDLEAEEEKTVLEGIAVYELAGSGGKLLYAVGPPASRAYGIVEAKPGQKSSEGRLDLDGLEVRLDPRAEWRQAFVDGWRLLRDWFYDPGMHGLDWQAMREKYEPLVEHVAHRADLDYIFGELGGELSAGHVYVQSPPSSFERRESGLLGAEIVADPSGYFRVAEIFPGENWHEDFRSPLTEPGIEVDEGDLILAVDGVSTRGVDNFFRLLEGAAGRTVTLRVAEDASGRGARDERVRPVTRETNLRYLAWVASRRAYVTERSGGRIGYIHLPNTAVEGSRELYEGFYAQASKAALILDDRYNGGGFIPSGMIELLERPLLSYWTRRNVEPFTTPGFVHRGPKAVLINGYAASGGDAFPYYFRERGLGPLIGTRTWGGLIGLSGGPSLADGGSIGVPTFRFVAPGGEFAVEGEGVAPDIVVVDRPDLEARGIDPSLDRAIEYLLEELEKNPPAPLIIPDPPSFGLRGPRPSGS